MAFVLLATSAPALAQKNESMVIVYGEDACPPAEDSNEIVVCARRPESERYRIPKRFREKPISPQNGNESWAVRAQGMENAGRSGIGSCSASGPGAWTGCYIQWMNQMRAERRAQKAEEATVP